jgi:hypothetical protein
MRKFCLLLFLLCFPISVFAIEPVGFPDPQRFPLPKGYEPNVRFWMKVYGEWEQDEMVIHDSRNMDVVFEVIEIPEENEILRAAAMVSSRAKVDQNNRI